MNPFQEMQARQQQEKLFEVAVTDAYKATPYKVKDEMKDWLSTAATALLNASPLSIGLSPTEFVELIVAAEVTKKISLYQLGNLCNNLEARTPKELGYTLAGYTDLMKQTAKYVKEWNEIAKGIVEKLQQDRQMKEVSLRNEPMKIIKAEA